MTRKIPVAALTSMFLIMLAARGGMAQTDVRRFEVGAQFISMEQRAFDKVDCGFGGRFTYYPLSRLGVEAEANFFPMNLGKPATFSRHRTEVLFGFKAGPRFGPFGFFGKLRPGFVNFARAPRGPACITLLIYPPPLECSMSAGNTNFALDMGGGVEVLDRRLPIVVRVDFGDTMIRFDGPAYTSLGRFNGDFSVHNFQVNVGFAYRF